MDLRQITFGVGAALVGTGGAALYTSLNPAIDISSRLLLYYGGLGAIIFGASAFAWLFLTRPNPAAYLIDIIVTLNNHRTPGELQLVITLKNTGTIGLSVKRTSFVLTVNGAKQSRQVCDDVTLRAGTSGTYHIDLGPEALEVAQGAIGAEVETSFGRAGKAASRKLVRVFNCVYSSTPFGFQSLLVSEREWAV